MSGTLASRGGRPVTIVAALGEGEGGEKGELEMGTLSWGSRERIRKERGCSAGEVREMSDDDDKATATLSW